MEGIPSDLVQAFAKYKIGVTEAHQPAERPQDHPNWDGTKAFRFYGRVAVGACACAQHLSSALAGRLGKTQTLTIQEVMRTNCLPDGPVWVHANDKREGWEPAGEILTMPEKQWLRLLEPRPD